MEKRTLFGTSGIRGDAEKLFTSQFCFDIGRVFVKFLKENLIKDEKKIIKVAIGMDPRGSSPRIKESLIKGLIYEEVEVFDEGVTPIPSINWLIKNTDIASGMMITGSHIAADLNGVKFYAHNEEITKKEEAKINELYEGIKNKVKASNILGSVVLEEKAKGLYREMLAGLVSGELAKWKIAVDTANGGQSVVMPELLRNLGLNVLEVNCDPQKDFIARDTDTDDKAQIEDLKKLVVTESCDLGVAYDGDGDRVVFIDEKGVFVKGEYSCGLVAKEQPGEAIVTTVSASMVVEHLGKKVVRTKVGSPYVVAAMKENNCLFGFEPNGGAVSAEIMYTRDGGSMTMKILNLFNKFVKENPGKHFSDMVATLPTFYMFRTKVDYKWELQQVILDQAQEKFKGISVDETDGLKIWLDEKTWILFRSSQNAPEFRVFAESDRENKAKNLMQEGINLVNDVIKNNGR